MARLLGIGRKANKRATVEELDEAEVHLDFGVDGDWRGKTGRRQVTIMTRASWQAACDQVGKDLPWTVRRANLLVDDLDLRDSEGGQIRVGNVCLEVVEETKPCQRMDEQVPGLTDALRPDWRGGVCCRVITAGRISIGDAVEMALVE
jgi:MOSC domain-containing protein YiiM